MRSSSAVAMPVTNPYHSGPRTDHFDGLRFFNPGEPSTDRTLTQVLRWKLAAAAATWPKRVPVEQVIPDARVEGMRVTVIGHATVLIQVAGLNLLTDPVWSERASPSRFAGPRRVTMPGIAFENLPAIDVVLLSHNHYDHLDIATLKQLHDRHRPLIVTPLGNGVTIRRHVPGVQIVTGDWGASFRLRASASAHIVPANHWSSRTLADRRMALWGGFIIDSQAGRIYFAGDTGYGTGNIFRAIREAYGAPDLALIPIGAYAPRWFMSAQHCSPEEAVQIMLALDARRAIGVHWGTFKLTDEPHDEPAERLERALAERSIAKDRFEAARPGRVWNG